MESHITWKFTRRFSVKLYPSFAIPTETDILWNFPAEN